MTAMEGKKQMQIEKNVYNQKVLEASNWGKYQNSSGPMEQI